MRDVADSVLNNIRVWIYVLILEGFMVVAGKFSHSLGATFVLWRVGVRDLQSVY